MSLRGLFNTRRRIRAWRRLVEVVSRHSTLRSTVKLLTAQQNSGHFLATLSREPSRPLPPSLAPAILLLFRPLTRPRHLPHPSSPGLSLHDFAQLSYESQCEDRPKRESVCPPSIAHASTCLSDGCFTNTLSRALFVKNLSYNVSTEDLFDLFGKFGPIRQIRQGIATNTKGTAFVVYEDVMDAKAACDKLNGFNFQNRYLVVLYHQQERSLKAQQASLEARQEELEKLKRENGID